MPLMHPELHPLLTTQAGLQNGAIDVRRVGIWLHSIQGQIHDGCRLMKVKEANNGAAYALKWGSGVSVEITL